MPRTARASVGGICYHVLNRGNGRANGFRKDGDFAAFVKRMASANERLPLRLLGYRLLNNHFHVVLWPYQDGDLSRWMQWLLTSHVRHYHSSGHVWQGRFKAFPIQHDDHLLTVLRYATCLHGCKKRRGAKSAPRRFGEACGAMAVVKLGLARFRQTAADAG